MMECHFCPWPFLLHPSFSLIFSLWPTTFARSSMGWRCDPTCSTAERNPLMPPSRMLDHINSSMPLHPPSPLSNFSLMGGSRRQQVERTMCSTIDHLAFPHGCYHRLHACVPPPWLHTWHPTWAMPKGHSPLI